MSRKRGKGLWFALTTLALAPGCAALSTLPGAPPRAQRPEVDSSSASALERSLEVVRTEKVEIPTELLRSIFQGQRNLQSRCDELDSQLRQLKKVDLDRGGEGT